MEKVFNYNGCPITFNTGDSIMINATEMAKPFGKLAKDWLSNNATKSFLSELSAVRGIVLTELVRVVQGGTPEAQGTWMHEDVALEFARWLSPRFAIWCNDRVKELLTAGHTEIRRDVVKQDTSDDFKLRKAEFLRSVARDYEQTMPKASQAIMAHVVFDLTGERLLPNAKTDVRYTATDIARACHGFPNVVGAELKRAGLQTSEYGEVVADITKQGKQVSTFQYNEMGYRKALEVMEECYRSHPKAKRA